VTDTADDWRHFAFCLVETRAQVMEADDVKFSASSSLTAGSSAFEAQFWRCESEMVEREYRTWIVGQMILSNVHDSESRATP